MLFKYELLTPSELREIPISVSWKKKFFFPYSIDLGVPGIFQIDWKSNHISGDLSELWISTLSRNFDLLIIKIGSLIIVLTLIIGLRKNTPDSKSP